MCVGFLFLLFFTDNVSTQKCSYQDVLDYLNLTKSNEVYTLTRPVLNHKNPTLVEVAVTFYAVLEVYWTNERISWKPEQFCGINHVTIPSEIVWKPDIIIAEMIDKDKVPPSPYLILYNTGEIYFKNDQVLVSTCRMQMYHFPFDIQSCNLTFTSVIHPARELQLRPWGNSSSTKNWSLLQPQDVWQLLNVTVTHFNHSTMDDREQIITMKRRSVLYIFNLILPLLFFLCLDVGSFLISDSGGEKLSFKVTVLLAVTVLQLILNEILPSMSNKIPLIATFCIVIFGLMLLSLLETILVMYLREKDSLPQENEANRNKDHSLMEDSESNFQNCDEEEKKLTRCACICDVSGGDTPCELLPVPEEGGSRKPTGESQGIALILEELREMEKTLTLFFNNKEKGEETGYWTRVARRLDLAFFVCYVVLITVFLVSVFGMWDNA
ncbi:5-hydroxytryptamine receptor 3A-like [Polymixia lowei]